MKINVSKEDIKSGKKCDSEKCAVALAVHRAFNNNKALQISVLKDNVCMWFLKDSGEYYQTSFDLPTFVSEFVLDFDTGEEVEPFDFTFPEELLSRLKKEGLAV